jgi:RNA polymerase sigma-70 factor (ECF subfamily)
MMTDRDEHSSHREKKERFMGLFHPLHGKLSRFARGMTGSHEEARDLVHDTALVAFEQFGSIRDQKAFLCYLFTVATRIYRKRQRRMRWFGSYNEERARGLHDSGTTPEASADVALLYEALKRLPAAQRESVVLFEISGLSLQEIRQIQGGSLSGVKSRVTRGRRRLAEILGADDSRNPDARAVETEGETPADESSSSIFSIAHIHE